MNRTLFLMMICAALISSCAPQSAPVATPLPPDYLPTVVALTGQAAFATQNALTPTATATPPPTETPLPLPTSTEPTLTPTPEPGFTKFADLRFVSPGPMSSLTSPINLKLLLTSGKSDLVRVDLLGEDGRTLYTDVLRVDHNNAGSYRAFDVIFETRAVSEKGYFRLSTKDEHGNLQGVNSMPVLLYSVGENILNLPGNMIYERITFENLKNKQQVYGGEIQIKGKYWPFNKEPVFLDLILPDGKIVNTRELAIKGIEPQVFETTLPYKVDQPTTARIAIHQDNPALTADAKLKRFIYFYSIEVTLNP